MTDDLGNAEQEVGGGGAPERRRDVDFVRPLRHLLANVGRRRWLQDGAILEPDAESVAMVISGGMGEFAEADHLCIGYFGPGALFTRDEAQGPVAITQSIGSTCIASLEVTQTTAALGEVAARRAFAAIAMASWRDAQVEALSIGCHTVARRVAHWLDRLAPEEAEPLLLTQERLAQILGVQRTSANAALQGLRNQGVIRFSRGRLTIRDRQALRNIAAGSPARADRGSLPALEHSTGTPAW